MTTLNEKVFPTSEKVLHVAYTCGCVRSFHVEREPMDPFATRCYTHGDGWTSFTEEYQPTQRSAA